MNFTDYECKFCGGRFRSWDSNVRGWCNKAACRESNGIKLKNGTLADVMMTKLQTGRYVNITKLEII